MRVSRRTCLTGLAGAAGCAALSRFASAQLKPTQATDLTIQTAQAEILPGTMTDGLISTSMDRPPPVLKMNQGQVFRSRVTNTLPDYTAMHWHGIRVPNGMDGVPYLTQIPFGQDEIFDYEFTPEDAGTYWYHPHCMTMDQMALGLTGVLTVAEAEDPGYDADIAFNLRDFRLNGDGEFIELWTARG
ncbi:MAG: multicopper oxidase domain-containing protein, partial [Pseudomonadota bacterium]